MSDLYTLPVRTLAGKDTDLSAYKGHVLLIVNTASQCGFTPHYAGLETLYRQYKDQGLVVLGFPCNQFGAQEPGKAAEIASFCSMTFGVDFPMFDKVEVNGPGRHPLYAWLTSQKKGLLGTRDIKWNFTKFLTDREGRVVARYAPQVEPEAIAADIEKLI
jgi:glutathione peroxidase